MWRERGTRHFGDQDVAGRDARQFAFAIDHDGAAGAPADAGRMAVEPGMPQPDLVRHDRRFHMQRPRLQQLEAALVHRPFDLDRPAGQLFRIGAAAGRASPPRPAVRHGSLTRSFGTSSRRRDAVRAGVAMALAAGLRPCAGSRFWRARCGRAPPRLARSPSRGPRWRKSASALPRFRSRPPPEARAATSGWISTPIAVSAGDRP